MRHKGTSEVDCGCRLADTPLIVGNSDNTGCGHRGMGWDFRPLALGHRLSSFIAPEMACGGPLYHSSIASPPVAYSTPNLPLIPRQSCPPFHTKVGTDSIAKLPPNPSENFHRFHRKTAIPAGGS